MPVTPGAILITVVFLLSLLVTISAPNVRTFDAVRTYFYGNPAGAASNAIDQVRVSAFHRLQCWELHF